MTAQDDALASLSRSGLLAVVGWAAPVGFRMTADDYDEERGHDQAILGLHNFVHIRDLMDRATSNGRFALSDDVSGEGRDVVRRGISPAALASMPQIPSGAIIRKDYHGSPGWAADGHRLLLQSYKFDGIDKIQWGQRSNAKRQVANQHYVHGVTLFDDADYGLETLPGIPDDDDFAGVTLVAAHAYDPVTGRYELFIGQSKNPAYRGDGCWYWRQLILRGGGGPQVDAADTRPTLPGDPASIEAEEIAVRLRRPRSGEAAGSNDE
jgi:hypothetical protein